ncbi:HAMP domain-containing sensor histidine kinase, partial [Gammaproteobacteria bacterium]|nr:HAMP domain-containing sensor histidine kinase [Gammaproteobacteria bacterium]
WHLVLIFNGQQAAQLAFYYGALPLIVVLTATYLLGLRLYHTTGRTIAPIERLAARIQAFRPSRGKSDFDASEWQHESQEIASLARSIEALGQRIDAFSDRERRFTRDASHELRSPLTVIRMSTEHLRGQKSQSPVLQKEVARIGRAVDDMEELVGTFLWLARAQEDEGAVDAVSVIDALESALTTVKDQFIDNPIPLTRDFQNDLRVRAPHKLIAIVLGNLLRNAFNYTDAGEVTIRIVGRRVSIIDTGIGMEDGQLKSAFKPFAGVRQRGGVGIGLTIVKSVVDRFGWSITIDSTPRIGTRIDLDFSDAEPCAVPPQMSTNANSQAIDPLF